MSDKDCTFIAEMYQRLHNGDDPEEIVPYDMSGMSDQCFFEACMFYLRYGKDPERLKLIRSKVIER